MQYPGRLAAAIEVLTDLETRHRPISGALRDWGLAHRFAGSGDRAAIGNLVYDALRQRQSLAWRIGADTPRALVLGTAILGWGGTAEALNSEFETSPHAPEKLSAQEISEIDRRDLSEAPDHVRADLPEWLIGEVERTFGADWVAEGAELAKRPPLDMRVNLLKLDVEKAERQLSGLGAQQTAIAPTALRIAPVAGLQRHPNVKANQAYQRGRVEIQDESSQICALLCDPQPKDQVLDYCAGAGGKALALSALMGNRGQIHAHDRDAQRLAPIFERLKRAGAHNVQIVGEGEKGESPLIGRMDLVLVDAPCSGSGVWRRRPDAKWRLSADMLLQRQNEQDQALDEAAPFVRPDGRLIYATCSILASENEDRVAAFAARHPEFEQVDLTISWTKVLRPSAPSPRRYEGGSVIMSPLGTLTDGFFMAAFQRKAN